MATQGSQQDQAWGALAGVSEAERRSAMKQRYVEVARLPEAELQARMLRMAHAEYALADAALRTFTLSRLKVWLELPEESARKISASYDSVMQKMPGQAAMRRVSMVQTLARDFSPEDEARLRLLIPGVLGALPAKQSVDRLSGPASPSTPAAPESPKKGIWPFRKK